MMAKSKLVVVRPLIYKMLRISRASFEMFELKAHMAFGRFAIYIGKYVSVAKIHATKMLKNDTKVNSSLACALST